MERSATRFWAKVDLGHDADECWPWTASVFKNRGCYGKFQAGTNRETRKAVYAHRWAYEWSKGPIPPGMCVLHSCDNPPCCNPAHLSLGTRADNLADMCRKRRHWAHKLKDGNAV